MNDGNGSVINVSNGLETYIAVSVGGIPLVRVRNSLSRHTER